MNAEETKLILDFLDWLAEHHVNIPWQYAVQFGLERAEKNKKEQDE